MHNRNRLFVGLCSLLALVILSGGLQPAAPVRADSGFDAPWLYPTASEGSRMSDGRAVFGAIAAKGPQGEPIAGVVMEIRRFQSGCSGQAVWRSTTSSLPQSRGAFGFTLDAALYCLVVISAPYPYSTAGPFRMYLPASTGSQWFTVWLPGPVFGAVVAKDSAGLGVDGVTATIWEGTCSLPVRSVWRNTTATGRWSSGGFGVSLPPGSYCTVVDSAPGSYGIPDMVETTVTRPGPVWITLWMPAMSVAGTGDTEVEVDLFSGEHIVEFVCAECTGAVVVEAVDDQGLSSVLVSQDGPYPFGRTLVGILDPTRDHYGLIAVTASGQWSLGVRDESSARPAAAGISGSGDEVISLAPTTSWVSLSHHGPSSFDVMARDRWGNRLLLVTSDQGDYWSRNRIQAPALLQIFTTGRWDVIPG